MSEQIPEAGTVEENPQNVVTPPTEEVDVEALIAERDKWKSFARKHEDSWKTASQELDELRRAGLSDAEKAIADAEARGRQAALSDVGSTLAEAELRVQASLAGVEVPESVAQYLDVTRFIGTDGSPDKTAIAAFVSGLAPADKGPKFPQNVGIGPQGGGSGIPQLTREDLARMTPAQVNAAREAGQLNTLMFGEL